MEIIKVDNAANKIHSTPIHLMHHINSSDINNFMKIQGQGLMSGACLDRKGSSATQQNPKDPQTRKQPTEDQILPERILYVKVHMHDYAILKA